MERASDILRIISARKAAGEPFALATVVRTVAATAAKAGAKAVILPDGTISEGWIGGGCARAAVLKAAKDALTDGKSRLVSVQPPDLLDQQGHAPGEEQGGVRFAKNMCPSEGTMDIFVEARLATIPDHHLRVEPSGCCRRGLCQTRWIFRHGLRADG
jgi:xanthine dehydrogenase accessory factor